jgi:hypothetical protein
MPNEKQSLKARDSTVRFSWPARIKAFFVDGRKSRKAYIDSIRANDGEIAESVMHKKQKK